ncbi:unnamed protein product [Ilex paraguariensis]|uniref:Amino acid transporter transmembrane domain-containing protein n=1 Tax=Ilex paraguariensis TaxID=185542 RepID=A0ABC8SCR7_9AQUA
MEAKPHDGCSVTIPLLLGNDEKQHELSLEEAEGVDSIGCHSITGTTSFFKTCFNGLNALSGVGILSVPYALASGGWLSLILLLIIASTSFYTGLLIQRCMDIDPSIRSYPDIGERAFDVGVLEIFGLRIGGRQCFVLIVSLIILPTVWLNSISFLSYISATGVLASFLILGSILWAGVFDGIGFQENGTLLNWNEIPTSVSLYAFCYCAHPVFPTLYTSMRNPKLFSKVLLLCFLLCTITYASMAVFGYLMFGSEVESQVTLNLPTEKISSRVAIYTSLLNPISKYALMVMPIVHAAENRLRSCCNRRWLSFVISTTMVISSVVVALAIPFFGLLMTLVGALLSVTGSILLPCMCYLKISGTYQEFGFELVLICGIVVMGLLIGITGSYTSLVQIIEHL